MDWQQLLIFLMVGFLAQMVDGALGMAYGVTSTSILLSMGIPAKFASAGVHSAEVFTTAISGLAHLKLRNVNRKLLLRLAIPGVIGGVLGAYVLTMDELGKILKPGVNVYLLLMGLVIIRKAFGRIKKSRLRRYPSPLGLVGGFFDAIGGGGWGPIVTTTLVGTGRKPRFVIGSVNAAEFFVTIAQVITFAITLTAFFKDWEQARRLVSIVLGLLLGGVLAAPLAATVTRKLPTKALMIMIGLLISVVSAFNLYKAVAK